MSSNNSQNDLGNTAVDSQQSRDPRRAGRGHVDVDLGARNRKTQSQRSPAPGSPVSGSPVPASQRTKPNQRRSAWQWNLRLLGISAVGVAALLIACSISYFYHSRSTAQTLLTLAKTAESEGKFDEQSKWLRRYSLLESENTDVIYEMAVAADRAADGAKRERLGDAINEARRSISNAVARLGAISDTTAEQASLTSATSLEDQDLAEDQDLNTRIIDLRRRLIKRLGQLGGVWNREAERQIAELNATPGDPESLAALARALLGQLGDGTYEERQAAGVSKSGNYWRWLANQQVGYVIAEARVANPASIEFASSFLLASKQYPDQFLPLQGRASLSQTRLSELTAQSIKTLQADSSSRSKLALYEYFRARGKQDEATEIIRVAAASAEERLAQYATFEPGASPTDKVADHAAVPASNHGTGSDAEQSSSLELPAAYWDYVLVSEWARQKSAIEADRAQSLYSLLIRIDHPSIPSALLENAYLESAQLHLARGESDETLRLYREALQRVDANSLPLLRSLARLQLNLGEIAAANQTTEQLREAIDIATRRLARASEQEMDRSQRISLGRTLDAARWHLSTLQGFLAAGQNRDADAISLLQKAAASKADVSREDRVMAITRLAQLLGAQGVWDQSAAMLDQATELAPNSRELRLMAADAWTRAGNQQRAMEQWSSVEDLSTDPNPALKFQLLQARFNDQLRVLPDQRNFDHIRSEMDQLAKQLDGRNWPSGQEEQGKALVKNVTLLGLMIPPANVDAETHLHSPAFAESVEKLSAQADATPQVLAYAAERLAQAKLQERSLAMLERFKASTEVDVVYKALVEARVLSALGDDAAAAQLLNDQADRMSIPSGAAASDAEADDNATQLVATQLTSLREAASEFARRGGDLELAYRSLAKLTPAQQTLTSLFVAAELAQQLPSDSGLLSQDGKTLTPDELADQWASRLREREGDSGPHWQYLEVMRLVREMGQDRGNMQASDSRIVQARQQISRILAVRPRWGEALSLQGYLSALEGKAERSIDQLHRGIAAGDQRMSTRQLLWEQLIAQGRLDEAEREIQLASLGSQSNLSRTTGARIDVARRQGDYAKSIQVAQQAAAQTPTNVLAHLVVAATATAALRNVSNLETRDAFREQAAAGIAAARLIAGDQDARVLSADLRLALASDEEVAIEQVIAEIENSQAGELEKSQLLAQAFIAIKQFDKALPCLLRAEQIDPTSKSQMLLSELYRLMDRRDDEVAALRSAQKRDPSNTRLRNLLAQKLVAASASGGNIDWEELSSLLSEGDLVRGENRLLHAVLLGSDSVKKLADDQGSQAAWQRLDNAQAILKDLIASTSSNADDARRLLALLLQEQRKIDDLRFDSKIVSNEICSLYESLSNRGAPQPTDVYRYASYLLDQNDDQDDPKLANLLQRLHSDAGDTLQCLEVDIRIANRAGEASKSPEIVSKWVSNALGATPQDADHARAVLTAAGSSLLQLGFLDESIDFFKQAYQRQPAALGTYVLALGQARQFDEALQICSQHFDQYQDPLSATLFLEILLGIDDLKKQARVASENEELIETALKQHIENEALLESVGTIRMTQDRFDDAVKLFQRALKGQPTRIRSLNNLAMSLAQLPGRAMDGIPPINAALELTNQNPEILDTKGVVLLAAGRADQAETTFKQAFEVSSDSRHQFHVIVAQLAQNKVEDAKKSWQRLDLKSLDPKGLTSRERIQLDDLTKQYNP